MEGYYLGVLENIFKYLFFKCFIVFVSVCNEVFLVISLVVVYFLGIKWKYRKIWIKIDWFFDFLIRIIELVVKCYYY